jgi:hypothetical protein
MWRKIGKYLLNLAISLDQFGNALKGGDPDETISSTLGKLKRANGGRIPWSHPLDKIVDWGLEKIDSGHSIDAIEEDEGINATFDKVGKDG